MKRFKFPKKSLGSLEAEAAANLLAAAADVALIIDRKGVIRDLAFGSDELAEEFKGDWIGQPWQDTVTVESQAKVAALLREAGEKELPRWRQVNHATARGPDLPIVYSTLHIAPDKTIAIGRDLRAVASLQQRLMQAELSMERDYARLRHTEMRYRLLFQMATEAVIVIDAASRRIVEANPAAGELLGGGSRRLVGRTFPEGFDTDGNALVAEYLTTLQAAGRADEVRVRVQDSTKECQVSAALFRQDNAAHFLVRLTPLVAQGPAGIPKGKSKVLDVVEQSPDGFVITDPTGRILTANRAFIDFTQLATLEQVRGEPLDRWIGRPGVDLNVLIANLRQHGSVRLFTTTLRGEYGTTGDIEIAAVSVLDGSEPCLGFAVRNVERRVPAAETRAANALPRSVEQLTELVGRVSLKDLVRETTDVIERLCIEAALELTGDNRASAAEMLGLSRQSLYVKLRRYGLGDLEPESERQQA